MTPEMGHHTVPKLESESIREQFIAIFDRLLLHSRYHSTQSFILFLLVFYREFLRMGNPLNCIAPEAGQMCKPGGPVPLTRIKTLVSMTTPRDYR